jgi:hypothetical protein
MAGWLLASESQNAAVPHSGTRNSYYLKKNVYITSSGVFDQPVFDCALGHARPGHVFRRLAVPGQLRRDGIP